MKKSILTLAMMFSVLTMMAENRSVSSPDGQLEVTISNEDGQSRYAVTYDQQPVILPSLLGVKTNIGDFSTGLTMKDAHEQRIDEQYTMRGTKASSKHYVANELRVVFENGKKQQMTVVFQVANNDIAFRYEFPTLRNTHSIIIDSEQTSFRLPEQTTTFLCPQSDAMVGFARTKPSYEEDYHTDVALTERSRPGHGYTFPCLFKAPLSSTLGGTASPKGSKSSSKGQAERALWVLISETGAAGAYPGTRLSDYSPEEGYTIAFPMAEEANGFGTTNAALALPGATVWRTITVGNSLKPIVETTVAYDVVKPVYEPSTDYKGGRYTWSWLIWQDNATNYNDQVKFIDLAAAMGYEYCLVDAMWDTQIGRDKMEELSKYAQSKGVRLMLWYNSNGYANDAPQSPKNGMNSSVNRKREMAWMQKIGVAGIKVDFFGGDKQHTMQLYEDILSDANDYGLQVIFHGCTLPRGWERLYPNFAASEAVLASENVFFSEYHAKQQAFELTMHPFCRNAVASMDWGGVIMNKYLAKDNKSRHRRYTTDTFEMATAITNQSPINCIAIQPNNLDELPQHELDFLREVPTTWDETRFLDGYPGKYVVMARRHGQRWYVAGLNAEAQPLTLTLTMPELAGKTATYYYDDMKNGPQRSELKGNKRGEAKVTIQPNGGIIVTID